MIFNMVGGGAALNYKIVEGTTEPSNPSENTIWVNTDIAITDYVFSTSQPEGIEGRVWIIVGTSSAVEFNALKKNAIQIYPTSMRQYVSGSWVPKIAKTYQNGTWVDWWDGVLYEPGMTEGLTALAWESASDQTARTPKISYGSDSVTLTMDTDDTGLGGRTGVAYFDPVDLTPYKTLSINFTMSGTCTDSSTSNGLFVWESVGNGYYSSAAARAIFTSGDTSKSIDVSTLEGMFYIGVGLRRHEDTKKITVKSIRLS